MAAPIRVLHQRFVSFCRTITQLNNSISRPNKYNPYYTTNYVNYGSNCNVQCWKCGRQTDIGTEERFVCSGCQAIQPPHPCLNHFDVIGTQKKFDIDIHSLTSTFRKLQMALHPDKFTQKSQEERDYSSLQSSLVNKAYFTLLKPVPRGLYMLELHGKSLEEGEITMNPAFLMEIMEINEEINSVECIEELKKIEAKNRNVTEELIRSVSQSFDEDNVDKAKELLTKIKYYVNIDERIKELYRQQLSN